MCICTGTGIARLAKERRPWADSREREMRPVDDALTTGEAARHGQGSGGGNAEPRFSDGATGRLCAVVPEVYPVARAARTRLHLGYPARSWADQAPPERRMAVLFRVANHIHSQGDIDRALKLRRWSVQSLMDEFAGERQPTIGRSTPPRSG